MDQLIDKTKPVMVSGASGYIATWIIKLLLEQGCTVHGTVRNPGNEQSVGPLKKLAEAAPQGTLKLFKADLLDEGSFDEAMAGPPTMLGLMVTRCQRSCASYTFQASFSAKNLE